MTRTRSTAATSGVWQHELDPIVRHFFVREVLRQAQFGIAAWEHLRASEDRVEIWGSVQAMLVAAGVISRLLWPTGQGVRARGAALRRMLTVSEDSPLASRDLRDSLEHFDERLDAWAAEFVAASPPPSVIGDSNIGPLNAIEGVDPRHLLRQLDRATWTLYFRGARHDLLPVADELLRLTVVTADVLKGRPGQMAPTREEEASE